MLDDFDSIDISTGKFLEYDDNIEQSGIGWYNHCSIRGFDVYQNIYNSEMEMEMLLGCSFHISLGDLDPVPTHLYGVIIWLTPVHPQMCDVLNEYLISMSEEFPDVISKGVEVVLDS